MINLPIDQAIPAGRFFNDRFYAASLACIVHAALFAAGTFGLMRGVEYGMDASNGMAEVDLVAAPAPAAVPSPSMTVVESVRQAAALEPDDIAEPMKTLTPPTPPAVTPVRGAVLTTPNLNGPLGDGSSPVPGTDATTVHHAGSSGSFFKPGYYRNPPPPYPEAARKLKQEGRVLLEITITVNGRVGAARLKESSGFPWLDEAAIKGVQNWRFKSASIGGLPVESVVDIPIRFELK